MTDHSNPPHVPVQLAHVPIGVELSPAATNVLGEIAAALVSGARNIEDWPACELLSETCGARLLENLDQKGTQRHLHHCTEDARLDHADTPHTCVCGREWSEVTAE